MITVTVHQKSGQPISGFLIEGHGEMDTETLGYDIVCAAVSAVSLTAALGLRDVLGLNGTYDSENGRMNVDIGEGGDEKSDAVIETMLRGIQEIKTHYPNRIQIKGYRR